MISNVVVAGQLQPIAIGCRNQFCLGIQGMTYHKHWAFGHSPQSRALPSVKTCFGFPFPGKKQASIQFFETPCMKIICRLGECKPFLIIFHYSLSIIVSIGAPRFQLFSSQTFGTNFLVFHFIQISMVPIIPIFKIHNILSIE